MKPYEPKIVDPTFLIPPNMDYEYLRDSSEFPLCRQGTDFDLRTAWWLAEIALLAYEHQGFARLVFLVHGFPGFRFFDGKCAECFVAHNEDTVIVAFRGTEIRSLRAVHDLYHDFDIKLRDFNGFGSVHHGFAAALEEIWDVADGLREYIDLLIQERDSRQVLFTGHSLGAAIATLAAEISPRTTALYTFGSPKVGDARFAAFEKARHFRVFNHDDPIVQAPPTIKGLRRFPGNQYVHCGQAWLLGSDHRLVRGDETPEAPKHPKEDSTDRKKKSSKMPVSGDGYCIDPQTPLQWGMKRLLSLARATNLDTHAPIGYAVLLWNELIREQPAGLPKTRIS